LETSNATFATCTVYQNSTGRVLYLPPQNKKVAIYILARVQAKLTGKTWAWEDATYVRMRCCDFISVGKSLLFLHFDFCDVQNVHNFIESRLFQPLLNKQTWCDDLWKMINQLYLGKKHKSSLYNFDDFCIAPTMYLNNLICFFYMWCHQKHIVD
jgi:hypothetical protein